MGKLEGKVAIVTGTSSGMGRAIAKLFAQEGAKVVGMARREERHRELEAEITAFGGVYTGIKADVTQEADWVNAVSKTVELYGTVDILINNAGGSFGLGPVETISEEDFTKTVRLNANGPFLGIKHVAPIMKEKKSGAIVNVASIDGIVAGNTSVSYNAAKGADRMITKSMAVELAPFGIRTNGIFPGFIDTEMSAAASQMPELMKNILSRIPMGRIGQPEEIAKAALFLACDDASYVNGTELVVDGGWITHN